MRWRRKWQPTPVFLPGTGKPGGLPSMGSHTVGHDWSDLAAAATWVWKYLFKTLLSVLLNVSPEVELLYQYYNPIFNFLRNSHAVFRSGYTILHSHQQRTGVAISPYPCYFLVSFVLITIILMGVNWYLSVVLICISLMIRCWASLHVLTSHYVFIGEMYVQVFCPFLSWVVCFLLLTFSIYFCVLDINTLLYIWFVNSFSLSVDCLFTLWIVSFKAQI